MSDDLVVDARGERCPVPVIRLARLVRDLPAVPEGAGPVTVRVLATDPAAAADVPAWCRMRGQRFIGAQEQADHTAYVIEVTPTAAAAGR